MDRPALQRGAAGDRAAGGGERIAPDPILELTRPAVIGGYPVKLAVALKNKRLFGLTQVRRRLDQRVEDRLQIERRSADELEYVGSGGLLLQRLAQLVWKKGVLGSDDGLGGGNRNDVNVIFGGTRTVLALNVRYI